MTTASIAGRDSRTLIDAFVSATNALNVDAALALFSPDAVIDDVSVGDKFAGIAGVRRYLEQYFVGYHTVSTVLSVVVVDDRRAKAHLDFTGDFGHETGVLDITVDSEGRISTVAADLD